MPIYEYRCADCDRVFEALQRVNDEPLDRCRYCAGPARRIISSPAIHFVGSGWYVTDYARKGEARKDDPRSRKSPDGKTPAEVGKLDKAATAGDAKAPPGKTGGAEVRAGASS